jgi:hypothetical protein
MGSDGPSAGEKRASAPVQWLKGQRGTQKPKQVNGSLIPQAVYCEDALLTGSPGSFPGPGSNLVLWFLSVSCPDPSLYSTVRQVCRCQDLLTYPLTYPFYPFYPFYHLDPLDPFDDRFKSLSRSPGKRRSPTTRVLAKSSSANSQFSGNAPSRFWFRGLRAILG